MGSAATVHEECCLDGEVARTNQKFFRKRERGPTIEGEADTAGAKNADEQAEEHEDGFEHLGVTHVRKAHAGTTGQDTTRRLTVNSSRRSRSASRRRIGGKDGKRVANFDHEASFVEVEDRGPRSRSFDKREDSPLIVAIKRGVFDEMAAILDQSPDAVNTKDRFQQTPLFHVTATGNMEALQLLLDCRAEADCCNRFGYTPLMRALRHGKVDVAEELLRHQACPVARDAQKSTALHITAVAGQPEALEWLLRQEEVPQLLQHKDSSGVTALLAASQKGHSEICYILLSARARPDCPDESGRTPLLYALARNNVDLANSLMDAEANVNTEDEEGRSVLQFLVENLIKFREKREIRDHTLCGVAAALEAKADPDVTNEMGQTPLCISVKHNDATLCAILAAYGADASITDGTDHTLVVMAKKKGFHDVEKILDEFGAVKTKKSPALNRSLLRAVYYGNMDAVKGLMARGAELTSTTRKGTPLTEFGKTCGGGGAAVTALIKNFIDDEKKRSNTAQAAKDSERIQAWTRYMRDTGNLSARMLRGVRMSDAEIILNAMSELSGTRPPEEGKAVATMMLSRFMVQRKKLIVQKAHTELRRLRARWRKKLMQGMAYQLEKWDKADEPDRPTLQVAAAVGPSEVKAIKASEFELQDAYAKRLEDYQVSAITEPLRLLMGLPALFAEVCSAYEGFPAQNDDGPKISSLQCPKCFVKMPSLQARDQHVGCCNSKVAGVEKEKRRAAFKAKVESCIHRLEVAGTALAKKAEAADASSAKLRSMRTGAAKEFPEAVAALQGAYQLMQTLQKVCLHRATCCEASAREAITKYGLQKQVSAKHLPHKYCIQCFVKEVSRACNHLEQGRPPCICLCAPCAFHMMSEMRSGGPDLCPDCGQTIKDIVVVKKGERA